MNIDTIQSILDEINTALTATQKHISSLREWASKLPDVEQKDRVRKDLEWMAYHSRAVRRTLQDIQDTLDVHRATGA